MARMPTIQGDDFLQTYQLQRALMRERQGGGKADWAKALMQRGASTAPVQSPLEGLARMLSAGVGGYFANQARTEGEASEQEMLARMIGQTEQRRIRRDGAACTGWRAGLPHAHAAAGAGAGYAGARGACWRR
jgi:hypothetical protein